MSPVGLKALDEIYPYTGHAHLVGITGAPGSGKSSLVNRLAYHLRHPPAGQHPKTVGVIAVDPTSPFTGGSVMGDRIRMRDLAGDPGVFIRSMATHGALGGLAHQTGAVATLMEAAGYELIFIETVGAGQSEVDIMRLAHTTLLVDTPGMGDEVQAIKAGILEIADVIVVNKADRPGADVTVRILQSMLEMAPPQSHLPHHHHEDIPGKIAKPEPFCWKPPIIRTIAIEDSGIDELIHEIGRHHAYLISSGEWTRRQFQRAQAELDELLKQALIKKWLSALPGNLYDETLQAVFTHRMSPQTATERLVNRQNSL